MCSPLKVFLLIVTLKATTDKWRFRFWLRGVQFVTAKCCTPLRSSLWCVAHRGDHLCVMLNTAEIISSVCCTPRRSSLQCVAHRGDFFETWSHGLHPRCAAHHGDNFVIEYLSEIETKLENTLACLSGAQMDLNHEKNEDQKSCDKLFSMRSRSLDFSMFWF